MLNQYAKPFPVPVNGPVPEKRSGCALGLLRGPSSIAAFALGHVKRPLGKHVQHAGGEPRLFPAF